MDSTELVSAFNKAKIGIMSQHKSVFISTILFSLKHSWTTEVPTAATDGIHLLINPDYFLSLTPRARIGLLAHESWHPAFDHMDRRKDLDAERWNKAGDYIINNMLVKAGYELPPGGLVDSIYNNMHTKQVYDLLPETPEGGTGYDCDIREASPADAAKQKELIKDIVIKAATQAKMQGENPSNLPSEIAISIDKLLNPKLPWHSILQNYMSAFAKDDYSYRKANRRFQPDWWLPSLYSEAVEDISIAIDTSGSVSTEDFKIFLTEINDIKEKLNPVLTTVIDFDTKINTVYKLNQADSVADLEFHGRGGTRLEPVFEYYKDDQPTVLIIFSDLRCSPITVDPGYPVIWIIINNKRATTNFGRNIYYETA